MVVAGLRVAAALVRLEVEDMALDHTGIPLDFDFPALLAYEGGLIPVLGEKQPHFIAGTTVSRNEIPRKHKKRPVKNTERLAIRFILF